MVRTLTTIERSLGLINKIRQKKFFNVNYGYWNKILDKAKEIEEKIKDSQEKIKQIKAEGSSGGGLVKVILNGNSEIEKIDISEKIFSEDKTMLEDLIVAAHNEAKKNLKTKTTEEITKATGNFGIPGFKWPF